MGNRGSRREAKEVNEEEVKLEGKKTEEEKDSIALLIDKIQATTVEFDHKVFLDEFLPKFRRISRSLLAIRREIL